MQDFTENNVLKFSPYVLRKFAAHFFYSVKDFFPSNELAKNVELKNQFKGQRCFVLGSGPSIKTIDLKVLAGEHVITQNNFHTHPDILEINPLFHVVPPKHHAKSDDKHWQEYLQEMERKLPAECKFIFGTNTKHLIQQHTRLDDRTYYVTSGKNVLFKNKTTCDLTKHIMHVPSAITLCLQVAVYLGFSEIYLVGMDLSQIIQIFSFKQGEIRWYEESKITATSSEKNTVNSATQSGNAYFQFWLMWRQLNMIKNYADSKGVKIINANSEGLLNVFPRTTFNDMKRELSL